MRPWKYVRPPWKGASTRWKAAWSKSRRGCSSTRRQREPPVAAGIRPTPRFLQSYFLTIAEAALAPLRENPAHDTGPRPSAIDGNANLQEHHPRVGARGVGLLPRACSWTGRTEKNQAQEAVSYTHLRAHETRHDLVCRL